VIAGQAAARYIRGEARKDANVTLRTDGKVRYTVPQRITEAKDTTVYFRVSDVYRDKKLVVRDGEHVLIERKKQKLAPGEMETVKLTAEMIKANESGVITISLEEV
jgi:hypothetical protein